MASFLFYCFLAYLLYNVIFKFVLPVYRTTKQVKRSFKNMQDRMQEHTQQTNGHGSENEKKAPAKVSTGDYIDFEEVKE